MATYESNAELVPEPNINVFWSVPVIPPWVAPMIRKISFGDGPIGVINGMSADEDGDLILYRKLCDNDYMAHPSLIGVKEIWIYVKLPPTE